MSSCCNANLVGSLSVGGGLPGKDGKSLEFIWEGTKLGVRREGETEYQFVDLALEGGANREIQFQVADGYIQWKYADEEVWKNIIALSELKGANGKSTYEIWLEQGNEGTVDDYLLSLKGETGPQGEQGLPGRDGVNGVTPYISIGTVTTLEAGQQATVENIGTLENPVFNFGIPKGEEGKAPVDEIVTVPIIDSTLTLTTDKYQTTTMQDNTTIVLPTVDKHTTIYLKFDTTSELTLILPSIKWQGDITIEANKTYEFIFTYYDSWLGGCVSYE